MDKIFSRKRIPIIFKQKKIIVKIYKILTIIIIAITAALRFERFASKLYKQVCEERIRGIATIITNEQTSIVMDGYCYEDIFEIEKDIQGNITMVKSNITNINKITSDIAVGIQEQLTTIGKNNISIPMGAFTGIEYFSGLGPNIPINILVLGSIESNIKSEFVSQGINQTIHRVYLELTCPISVLTPYRNISNTIVNQVLLEENIIVGKIPEAYYNLDGISKDSAIKMIDEK